MKRAIALLMLPLLSGCGLLGNSNAEYYQAIAARDEARASREASLRRELAASREAHQERMAALIAQASAGISDSGTKALTIVALGGLMGQGNIAEVALTTTLYRDGLGGKETPIAPPETWREIFTGAAQMLSPVIPWLGAYGIVNSLARRGIGTTNITAGNDIDMKGSLNNQQTWALGDGAATTTVSPEVVEVRPEVVEIEKVTTTTTSTTAAAQ